MCGVPLSKIQILGQSVPQGFRLYLILTYGLICRDCLEGATSYHARRLLVSYVVTFL
jgi:hypothetical protein